MRLPTIINPNTIKCYSNNESNRSWDENIPQTLREISIETIANTWRERPILDEIVLDTDRCLLMELLPMELPLSLTIPKIDDDIYWKKCYMSKWPRERPHDVSFEIVTIDHNNKRKNSIDNKKHWKQCFLEMFMRDYLETLKPVEYEAEQFKQLSDLCESYIKILTIRQLQYNPTNPNRIPLASILAGLKNLTELSLCFKQTYVGDNFTWEVLQVTVQDANLLAKGLEKCKQLKTFKLINSNIDDTKLAIILKSLLKHQHLFLLDLSHCKVSNYGCVALASFLMDSPLKKLILDNNRVGSEGIRALCYALCKIECNLQEISLKLNPIKADGGNFIIKALRIGAKSLKAVSLNGCGLGMKNSTLGEMIEHNTDLENLDLCNNPSLGEEIGQKILQGLQYNTNLKTIDVRLCNFDTETEFKILHKVDVNRTFSKRIRKPIIIEPHIDFEISTELMQEIEEVFGK